MQPVIWEDRAYLGMSHHLHHLLMEVCNASNVLMISISSRLASRMKKRYKLRVLWVQREECGGDSQVPINLIATKQKLNV